MPARNAWATTCPPNSRVPHGYRAASARNVSGPCGSNAIKSAKAISVIERGVTSEVCATCGEASNRTLEEPTLTGTGHSRPVGESVNVAEHHPTPELGIEHGGREL